MISWIEIKKFKNHSWVFCVRESGRENKSGDIWFFPRYCMLAPPKLESSDQNRAIKPSPPSTLLQLTMKNILNNIGAWGNIIWSGNFCFFRQIWRLSKKSNSLRKNVKKVFLCCQHKVGCLTWLASDKRLSRFSNSISPSCEKTFFLQILQTIGNFQIQLFFTWEKFQSF